jgi:hypothetical protein
VRGIVRPCRTHLGPDLFVRWQAHLCGLCLTLRDEVGQAERVLTGYDVLLLSVLVEAQAGTVETTTAAPCPLRGFTRATVVASTSDAGRLAAAGALVSAAAGLADKVADGDIPRAARLPAQRVAGRLDRAGTALAAAVGLDPSVVLGAPAASAAAEQVPAADLRSLLAPTGAAVASLFAHTAVVAGRPGNALALARAGRAFGALVHLLDAVEDHAGDAAAGRFNPLRTTGTSAAGARRLADELVAEVRTALGDADLPTGRSSTCCSGASSTGPCTASCPRRLRRRSPPSGPGCSPCCWRCCCPRPCSSVAAGAAAAGARAGVAASAVLLPATATRRRSTSTATAASVPPAVSCSPATAAPTSPATPAAAATAAPTADTEKQSTPRRPPVTVLQPALDRGALVRVERRSRPWPAMR